MCSLSPFLFISLSFLFPYSFFSLALIWHYHMAWFWKYTYIIINHEETLLIKYNFVNYSNATMHQTMLVVLNDKMHLNELHCPLSLFLAGLLQFSSGRKVAWSGTNWTGCSLIQLCCLSFFSFFFWMTLIYVLYYPSQKKYMLSIVCEFFPAICSNNCSASFSSFFNDLFLHRNASQHYEFVSSQLFDLMEECGIELIMSVAQHWL